MTIMIEVPCYPGRLRNARGRNLIPRADLIFEFVARCMEYDYQNLKAWGGRRSKKSTVCGCEVVFWGRAGKFGSALGEIRRLNSFRRPSLGLSSEFGKAK